MNETSYINAIGTAVPIHAYPQAQIGGFMADALALNDTDRRKLNALYRQTRIGTRHSVLPDYGRTADAFTFYPQSTDLEPFPTTADRMAVYRREVVPLARLAVENCLSQQPDFDRQHISHVVWVSCTGFYAPGPDIELIQALGLSGTTQRLAINFMGCYGAFNGLKAADAIVRAYPDAAVLVVCAELCTLHFQKKTDTDNLYANALFADGAAAVLVESQARTAFGRDGVALRMRGFFSDILPDSQAEMAWHVGNTGFEMVLSGEVPTVIRRGIGRALSRLLDRSDLTPADIGHYALHPGGRRILEVIEEQLGLSTHDNRHAYSVLRDYGNMSSATVLFVLARIRQELSDPARESDEDLPAGSPNVLSCAFGPGLTLESMLLEAVLPARTEPVWHHRAAAIG
jgi:alpha-pyrone synthase